MPTSLHVLCAFCVQSDVDFQSAFQSYVDGNGGTHNIASTTRVERDSGRISSDVQSTVLAADVFEPLQLENHRSTPQSSDVGQQQQNAPSLSLSSQPLGCSSFSSSSHSVVSLVCVLCGFSDDFCDFW